MSGAALVRANSVALPLRDSCVDLIITSPPYFGLRSYQDDEAHFAEQLGAEPTPDDFIAALLAVTQECVRVLKPTGSLFVNLGDKYAGSGGSSGTLTPFNARARDTRPGGVTQFGKARAKSLVGIPWRYAIRCIDDLGLILRAELIWHKPNGLPESVGDRVRRSHEQWFHFTREPRYFSAIDELRQPHLNPQAPGARPGPSGMNRGIATGTRAHADDGGAVGNFAHAAGGKLPGSVWPIMLEPLRVPTWLGVDHFAAFPQEWPRRLMLGWSPPGICVACGQGRRPLVEKHAEGEARTDHQMGARHTDNAQGFDISNRSAATRSEWRTGVTATITGWVCDCPTPSADTRPAVVLDPFGGSGTVAMVARSLGRFGISVDLSADYLQLARWRVFLSGQGSKSEQRTHRDRQGRFPL